MESLYRLLQPSKNSADEPGSGVKAAIPQAMVNEVLVSEGYAQEYTYDQPGVHHAVLERAQAQAQAAARGLWSPTTCGGTR